MVFIHRTSAHPYRADDLAIAHQRDATGEDDDPAAVSGIDAEKGLAGLGISPIFFVVRPLSAEVKALSMAMSMLATHAPSGGRLQGSFRHPLRLCS
jgi:hypothetical protein